MLYSKRLSDIKQLKQLVRDQVAPGRNLGHVDKAGQGPGAGTSESDLATKQTSELPLPLSAADEQSS